MTVGLVVVSHSAKVAEGVVELAAQMAGGVRIQAAGGADDGGIGTDATLIASAITAADEGDGVLILVDLGSAVLSAQLSIDEFVDEDVRGRVRIAEAPVVEGAVVAAIHAATGRSMMLLRSARVTGAHGNAPTRRLLMFTEVALAVILVAAAGLMLRTMRNLTAIDTHDCPPEALAR